MNEISKTPAEELAPETQNLLETFAVDQVMQHGMPKCLKREFYFDDQGITTSKLKCLAGCFKDAELFTSIINDRIAESYRTGEIPAVNDNLTGEIEIIHFLEERYGSRQAMLKLFVESGIFTVAEADERAA